MLLAALSVAGCDTTTPPGPPDPPAVTLLGHFATLTEGPDGAIRFTTTDVETGEVIHSPMVQFENLEFMSEMWVSPDAKRALFRGRLPRTSVQLVYVANTDGTEAHEIERFRNVEGYNYMVRLQWSHWGKYVLYSDLLSVSILPIGAGNLPGPEPIDIAYEGLIVEGDTLRLIRGTNWGDDDDHVVVAAGVKKNVGSPLDPVDLDVFTFKVPTAGSGPGAFERKLTTRPIRAYGIDLARGGHTAVAYLDASIPGKLALVTEGGTLFRRLVLPDGYVTESGGDANLTRVRWDKDGRHVVLYQRLTSVPHGLTEPYAIGVIDSEDPDLVWREYGGVNVGAKTLPIPLFETPPL